MVDELDTEYSQQLICPYCGYKIPDEWEIGADYGVYWCEECGKEFNYSRSITVIYSTYKKDN